MCSFQGKINELPNISVDRFDKENLKSTCFFLTHCHSDHMEGLTEDFIKYLNNSPGYQLYCSPISCLILKKKYSNCLNDCIKDLEENSVITIPGREDTNTVAYNVTVTVIPSGHCPGSVMYLFETARDTILFTGDFRIAKNDVFRFRQLQTYYNCYKKVHKIYFDATFLNKDYWEFPSRSKSLELITKIIRKWLDGDPKNHVNLKTSANIGYEDVFIGLAKEFKCSIHVEDMIYKMFDEIENIGRILTLYPWKTRIHCCYDDNLNFEHLQICTITLSAWKYKNFPDCELVIKADDRRYSVCYATHSSCSEIIEFLNYFKAKSLEPLCGTSELNKEEVEEFICEIKSQWDVED